MQCNETAMYMYAWVCASIGKSLCTVPRGKAALRAQGRWGLPAEETTHPPPGHTCQNPARPPTHPDRKINLWGGKSPSPAKEQNPAAAKKLNPGHRQQRVLRQGDERGGRAERTGQGRC